MDDDQQFNWAGNLRYRSVRRVVPTTVDEVASEIRAARKIKAVGSRHCFNDIADCAGLQISTESLCGVVSIGPDGVTVRGGTRYGQFCPTLAEHGLALANLASLPHISVVGACMTATHGSGVGNQNLAASVSRVEFVDGRGEIVRLSRGDADFDGVVVSLGALGVVTELTLDVQRNFDVFQTCYLDLPLASAMLNFDRIMSSGYSVSMFTDWSSPRISQVWIKRRVDAGDAESGNELYGAELATRDVHPIDGVSAVNCTPQRGVPGTWYERLPHFRMGFTPSAGAELQSEYFVAREDAFEALGVIESLRTEIAPLLQVAEIRTVAADEMWLSPNYRRHSVAFHFTWKPDQSSVEALLPKIERALEPFDVRPHWGKLFTMPKEKVAELYPRLGDFKTLMSKYDPEEKFVNDYLKRVI